jgi:hypothetical protein
MDDLGYDYLNNEDLINNNSNSKNIISCSILLLIMIYIYYICKMRKSIKQNKIKYDTNSSMSYV